MASSLPTEPQTQVVSTSSVSPPTNRGNLSDEKQLSKGLPMKPTPWMIVVATTLSLLSSPPLAADSSRTLVGEYISSFETGMQPLKAVFTPTGTEEWDVVFYFKFHGKKHSYEGTAEGSLDGGELSGVVTNESGRRTFTFQGKFYDGEFRGTHAEIKRTGERRTGSLTLAESS